MLAIILLAAGEGSRFNGIKQLAELNHGQTVLAHQLALFNQLDAPIYLVLGAYQKQLKQALAELVIPNVKLIDNPDWQQGIGSSIAKSVKYVNTNLPKATHIMVTLLDQACIKLADLTKLIDTSRQHPNDIVASYYHNQAGVPAIFPQTFFPLLAQLTGDQGAKKIIITTKQKQLIDMPNAAFDIDTNKQLEETKVQLCSR